MSFILFLVKTSTYIIYLLQICHPYHVVASLSLLSVDGFMFSELQKRPLSKITISFVQGHTTVKSY